jgi:hypothetical protein
MAFAVFLASNGLRKSYMTRCPIKDYGIFSFVLSKKMSCQFKMGIN